MKAVSRRGFLKQAGAAAAVVVAGGTLASSPVGAAGALAGHAAMKDAPLTPEEEMATGQDVVAQVVNARTGELSLFIGQRQVTLHDKNVAARLVRAAR